MKKFEIRTGHKADMWFAVVITKDDHRHQRMHIHRIFYDIQKCLGWIHEKNTYGLENVRGVR